MNNISKEQRIYLAMWRKAGLQPETANPVAIELPNPSVALTVRMAMYRAIRPYRSGLLHDPDLFSAAERFVLKVSKLPDGRAVLAIVPRTTLAAAELAMLSLGLDDEDLKLFEERMVDEKLENLISTMPAPDNPYFKRG